MYYTFLYITQFIKNSYQLNQFQWNIDGILTNHEPFIFLLSPVADYAGGISELYWEGRELFIEIIISNVYLLIVVEKNVLNR